MMNKKGEASKEDRRVGTIWGNRVWRESKSLRGAAHFRHPGICSGSEYAKDIQDMLRIQMEFMCSQLEAFGGQANRRSCSGPPP